MNLKKNCARWYAFRMKNMWAYIANPKVCKICKLSILFYSLAHLREKWWVPLSSPPCRWCRLTSHSWSSTITWSSHSKRTFLYTREWKWPSARVKCIYLCTEGQPKCTLYQRWWRDGQIFSWFLVYRLQIFLGRILLSYVDNLVLKI